MPAKQSPDPLDVAIQPAHNESPEDRQKRLADEAEARRISNEIDQDIKREKALRKKAKIVRLLLLGQSESGTFPSLPLQPGNPHSGGIPLSAVLAVACSNLQ